MKVLVTGCAGLLGANYSRHLIKNGHTVIGVDNFSGGYKAFLPKSDGFIFYKTNIENSADIELMHRYLEILDFKSKYLKKILVVMRYGGVSNNSIKKIIFQNIAILKFLKIHKKPFAIINFFLHKFINRCTQFLYARKYNNHQFKR